MAYLDEERFLNPSKGISNPRLIQAMRAVSEEDSPENRRELYQALLDSMLILPVAEPLSEAETPQLRTLERSEQLRLQAFEDEEGETLFIAFTDTDAVLAWRPEGIDYVAMRAPDLFTLAHQNRAAGLIINPAGPVGGQVPGEEMAQLAQGELPFAEPRASEVLPAGSTVYVGSPEEMPPESWQRKLRRALRQHPEIIQAYLFLLHASSAEPRRVLGLVFDFTIPEEERRDAIRAMLRDLGALDFEDETLDILVLEDEDFLQVVRDTVAPIYPPSVTM
jgi:hypothetical protein